MLFLPRQLFLRRRPRRPVRRRTWCASLWPMVTPSLLRTVLSFCAYCGGMLSP